MRSQLFHTALAWVCLLGFGIAPLAAQTTSSSTAIAPSDANNASAPAMVPEPDDDNSGQQPPGKLSFLPHQISDGLDVNIWGWLGYLQEKSDGWNPYWDGELQLDVNKSFGDRLAVTADVNFIDANDHAFGQLEQFFATTVVYEPAGTLLTVGKFNASFGVESRDFWNRSTGTTSLLFGAQPQDLIGIMLTQPIGQTGIKIRPFIANDFQGHADFDQPPSAGITVEYRPNTTWRFAVTNWVGPGFVRTRPVSEQDEYGSEYASDTAAPRNPAAETYSTSASGENYGGYNVVADNYLGPKFDARNGGTLYFVDAKAIWTPRPDLTLAVEGLVGTTVSSDGRATWAGAMVLANYDITDRMHVFGRWSFIDDTPWIVTAAIQRRHELSAGVGYEIYHNVELRTEYRHDFSDTQEDADSVSVHLAFGI
ncbi:MAG TPA: outer membrane beta-barrel protein [Tepidisphaeraceae bacterium]|jgi:hypothetical protein|nr:outer membrane beta-barrel protein [Tepidisphaeraceae bacterium]